MGEFSSFRATYLESQHQTLRLVEKFVHWEEVILQNGPFYMLKKSCDRVSIRLVDNGDIEVDASSVLIKRPSTATI